MKISNRHPKPPAEPEAWEYMTCDAGQVNQWGKDSWEAYAATAGDYGRTWIHLKRPLK